MTVDVRQGPRWSEEQVLALAPDAAAERAARGLIGDKPWCEAGASGVWLDDPPPPPGASADDLPPTLWGLCQGSGSLPYRTAVDLTEPAYMCTCPSRKLPCKHVLGLLLRWSGGSVEDGAAPGWVREWQEGRAERATKAAARDGEDDPQPGERTGRGRVPSEQAMARRAERITTGLDELDRWLADQVRAGLATAAKSGYAHWDTMAARLTDAQATGAAGILRRMAAITGSPPRLLAELAQLRLLVSGFRRLDELPAPLAASVRMRAGLPITAEEVLAGPRVRDRWRVLGRSDEIEDQLTVRRTWLAGAASERPVLVLSFAVAGRPFPPDLLVGSQLDADLCWYPGGAPPRGLVAKRHAPPTPITQLRGASIEDNLRAHAEALGEDPWLERWPMILADVVPVRHGEGWFLVDGAGDGLPLDPIVNNPWRLVSVVAGRGAPVVGEWSAAGLRPLSVFADGRLVRL